VQAFQGSPEYEGVPIGPSLNDPDSELIHGGHASGTYDRRRSQGGRLAELAVTLEDSRISSGSRSLRHVPSQEQTLLSTYGLSATQLPEGAW
jgi:hypothetical protein